MMTVLLIGWILGIASAGAWRFAPKRLRAPLECRHEFDFIEELTTVFERHGIHSSKENGRVYYRGEWMSPSVLFPIEDVVCLKCQVVELNYQRIHEAKRVARETARLLSSGTELPEE